MTIEVVRHVTVRTPHGGNDEREAKLNPDHDHDHSDDHDPDYDLDDGDDDDEKDKLIIIAMLLFSQTYIFFRQTNSAQCGLSLHNMFWYSNWIYRRKHQMPAKQKEEQQYHHHHKKSTGRKGLTY